MHFVFDYTKSTAALLSCQWNQFRLKEFREVTQYTKWLQSVFILVTIMHYKYVLMFQINLTIRTLS